MDKIPIKELRKLYKFFLNINPKENISHSKAFYYLNLSTHASRDEREFDLSNYKLLQNIISPWLRKNKNFNRNCKRNGYINYLNSFKESKYLIKKDLYLIIATDFLKYIKQILDILGLIIVVFVSLLIKNLKSKKNKLINQNIYSIYYWESKGVDSAEYYYPNINVNKNSEIFIVSFASSNILTISLLNSLKISKFLSPCNTLSFKGLFLSIFQFLHMFFYDLFLPIYNKNFHFLKFWIGWKKGAEIFYSLLTYNSVSKLVEDSERCEFISWHENQITNNAFALGTTYAIKKNNNSCNLSSYIGFPLSRKIKTQYLPIQSEINIGFCGQRFYLQDKDSKNEMDLYLKEKNISISTEIIDPSMLRIIPIKKEDNLNSQKYRGITIFTNDSYLDLITCVISLFNTKNSPFSKQIKEIKSKHIFIRLHPSLNPRSALNELKQLDEIPDDVVYKFIDHRKESIVNSMKNSNFCIFGLSTYLNKAIKLKCKVIAVDTNHINQIPIQSSLINSSNYAENNPW